MDTPNKDKVRTISYLIYLYRLERNIPGSKENDYQRAEHFFNCWEEEYEQCGSEYLNCWLDNEFDDSRIIFPHFFGT